MINSIALEFLNQIEVYERRKDNLFFYEFVCNNHS